MNDSTPSKYFDLHTTGVGYLHRVREVKPERGQPFLAVDISALHGNSESVEYTRFDCRVSGRAAQDIVRRLTSAIETDRKVLVGFKIGDLYADTFTFKRGERAGQTGISLKARLLRITWAKVDGEAITIHSAEQDSIDNERSPGMNDTVSIAARSPAEDRPPRRVRLPRQDPAFTARRA